MTILTLLPHSVLGLFPVALQPPPVVRSYQEGTVGLDRLAGSAGRPSSHGDVPVETFASFKSYYFLPLSRDKGSCPLLHSMAAKTYCDQCSLTRMGY